MNRNWKTYFTVVLVLIVLSGVSQKVLATDYSAIDLNPSGFDISQAHRTYGGQQVGYGHGSASDNNEHALLWNGSAESVVDLNPSGFDRSYADGISGAQQVGYGYGSSMGSNFHALLWSGTPESAVDLNPFECVYSRANGTNGAQQVGYGSYPTGYGAHAYVWSGSPESAVDLQQFLPNGFVDSTATSIDAQGNIVGFAWDGNNQYHAILWQPVPEPGTFVMLGMAALSLGFVWWRKRAN